MKKILFFTAILFGLYSCISEQEAINFQAVLSDSPSIKGNQEYLDSPYVTAGNRLYMVGHQNGTFPEIGWHIKGEMGGIWDQPIKLMDGFDAVLKWDDEFIELDSAHSFINYPYGNELQYHLKDKNLKI
ncbi:MAG: glycogen debranching protein, partial [Eudoraea sp.]|nr:glycogen debranching protein [Eudoraea sp.]